MKKQLEPVDLMVAVGLVATVFCVYLMFMAATGMVGTALSATTGSTVRTPTIMDAMEWVQPALGEAIVQNYLLEREAARGIEKAADRLNHALMAAHALKGSASPLIDHIRSYAAKLEADRAAWVQFVLGRRIVDFTARGARAGILSDTQSGSAYNRSMIELVKSSVSRMNDQFETMRQSILGWEIVTTSAAREQSAGRIQEQLGRAIVEITLAERLYADAIPRAQEQVASVVLVAVHTEQMADRFEQLAAADMTGGGQAVTFSEPRTWPEVPGEFILGASVVLIGIFFAGLVWPAGRRERLAMEEPAGAGAVYRKTG
jgi:hypothetical protein